MANYIKADNAQALGFPKPFRHEAQINYVYRVLMGGQNINTRQARFVGVHNLHSIAAKLRKRYELTTEHGQSTCPDSGELLRPMVDVLSMNEQQRNANLELVKKASK